MVIPLICYMHGYNFSKINFEREVNIMRYKTVSVLTAKNADERAETMKLLDNTGCSYLVHDLLNGKTEITIIEKAAPDKLDIATTIELIAAYNNAVATNAANMSPELLDRVRDLDIIEIADQIRAASMNIVSIIRRVSTFALCSASGIPISSPMTNGSIGISAEEHRVLTYISSCMDDIVEMISSDSEMRDIYKKMLTDEEDIAQYSEGKLNKMEVIKNAKDIIYQKMLNLVAARVNEQNNLKVFCTSMLHSEALAKLADQYFEAYELPHDDVQTMVEKLSDWTSFMVFFQWICGKFEILDSERNEYLRRNIVNIMYADEQIKPIMTAFLDDENLDLPDYDIAQVFDMELFIKFIKYMDSYPSH